MIPASCTGAGSTNSFFCALFHTVSPSKKVHSFFGNTKRKIGKLVLIFFVFRVRPFGSHEKRSFLKKIFTHFSTIVLQSIPFLFLPVPSRFLHQFLLHLKDGKKNS